VTCGAAAPEPASRERIEALFRSRKLHPLRPFLSPWRMSGRERLEAAGAVICRAVESLLGESPLGFTRLDVVCPPDAPHDFTLLEIQAGDPSAMGWHGALAQAFGEAPSLMEAHRATFEQLTTGRSIALAVKRGSIVESDFQLLAEHYEAHGWKALVVDPSELSYDGSRLHARGTPVDAVFRDALDELMPTPGGPALVGAVRERKVALMNPLFTARADDKSLLEALSTPARWDAETTRVLQAHVPWTRVVRDVDFSEHLLKEREQLVLKPVDGYGGIDVTLGPFASPAQWQAAVDTALAKPGRFVAQRYCALPRQPVHTLEGPADAYVVHSLWFCPQLCGAFYRGSQAPVVNVHQGGGLGPTFFTDEK
jgi:hypothetical protein